MLAKIAAYTEAHRPPTRLSDLRALSSQRRPTSAAEAIALVVENALDTVPCAAVFVPTRTGTTARMISRFNPDVWIVGLSREAAVCQGLAFSYGVHPVQFTEDRRTGATSRGTGSASTKCRATSPCWWLVPRRAIRTPITASNSCASGQNQLRHTLESPARGIPKQKGLT